ncbi:dTDP-glucose 4,6-dehydratase [Fictibacillus halophilus]|uniref:dTDP-glucose 4,6-dehydratase n=1 Tax=Fictibacillus halophilus TaxID=1610490 RepID=UPI003636179B
MSKTILVTGGAGFIGSNFIPYFMNKYPNYQIVNMDSLTYAADLENIKEVNVLDNYVLEQGDITNIDLVQTIFKKYKITDVIHFAAESHVDNSIKNPTAFAQTNIMGTLNLLDTARNYWMESPFKYKNEFKGSRFHHVSTDEVYGSLGETGYFTEESKYEPNSPYSASKASSDLLVRSYYHTYGMNVVTTNCSNNYGPKQHDEKLIPTLIRKAIQGEYLPIYGNGMNIRDWLFVLDHCKAVDLVFHQGEKSEVYLVGGKNEKTNIQIADLICDLLDKELPKEQSYRKQIKYVQDRPGHDYRYAIDASKLESRLGWIAEETFESGIIKTVEWYIKKYIGKESSNES